MSCCNVVLLALPPSSGTCSSIVILNLSYNSKTCVVLKHDKSICTQKHFKFHLIQASNKLSLANILDLFYFFISIQKGKCSNLQSTEKIYVIFHIKKTMTSALKLSHIGLLIVSKPTNQSHLCNFFHINHVYFLPSFLSAFLLSFISPFLLSFISAFLLSFISPFPLSFISPLLNRFFKITNMYPALCRVMGKVKYFTYSGTWRSHSLLEEM